jgi:uncharacterized protein
MTRLPSRFRRLDEILADLPVDDPILLTELDGYLTGVAVCPEPVTPAEWLPPIWGGGFGEEAPFEDPIDVRLFADMVLARHSEILRDLGRGKLQPIFDIDERNGEVLWEMWIAGFEMAMALRPDSWSAVAGGNDTEAAAALSCLLILADVASNETSLTSAEINTISDEAAGWIPGHVARLHAWRVRSAGVSPEPADRPAKVGRNAPCSCGSGKKHKRCCGAN